MNYYPRAQKDTTGQRDERVVVIWTEDLDQIIPMCEEFNEKLMKYVWRSREKIHSASTSVATSVAPSTTALNMNLNDPQSSSFPSAGAGAVTVDSPPEQTKPQKSRTCKILDWRRATSRTNEADPEKGADALALRPMRLLAPIYGGLAAALSLCMYHAILPMSLN